MNTVSRRRDHLPPARKPHIYFDMGIWRVVPATLHPFGVSDDYRLAVNYQATAFATRLNREARNRG